MRWRPGLRPNHAEEAYSSSLAGIRERKEGRRRRRRKWEERVKESERGRGGKGGRMEEKRKDLRVYDSFPSFVPVFNYNINLINIWLNCWVSVLAFPTLLRSICYTEFVDKSCTGWFTGLGVYDCGSFC